MEYPPGRPKKKNIRALVGKREAIEAKKKRILSTREKKKNHKKAKKKKQ